MQLRRAVPLSLVALLASAGCVSVAPQDADPVPVRGSVPPADAPELPTPLALPLGKLPTTAEQDPDADPGPEPEQDPGPEPAPSRDRARAKATPPRRARVPGPVTAHPRRRPAPPPRTDELCAAADGVVPPSIVDLCLRQYGR
ncbi:hypothetical protein AB0B78_16955 [Streptomyces sp. NPDC040724]|uniref:hypothetical protein n=1 Tax=Streptomyces sp. NPDC040724 TaxID=3155612 RepID=UPI0033CCDDF5